MILSIKILDGDNETIENDYGSFIEVFQEAKERMKKCVLREKMKQRKAVNDIALEDKEEKVKVSKKRTTRRRKKND